MPDYVSSLIRASTPPARRGEVKHSTPTLRLLLDVTLELVDRDHHEVLATVSHEPWQLLRCRVKKHGIVTMSETVEIRVVSSSYSPKEKNTDKVPSPSWYLMVHHAPFAFFGTSLITCSLPRSPPDGSHYLTRYTKSDTLQAPTTTPHQLGAGSTQIPDPVGASSMSARRRSVLRCLRWGFVLPSWWRVGGGVRGRFVRGRRRVGVDVEGGGVTG